MVKINFGGTRPPPQKKKNRVAKKIVKRKNQSCEKIGRKQFFDYLAPPKKIGYKKMKKTKLVKNNFAKLSSSFSSAEMTLLSSHIKH